MFSSRAECCRWLRSPRSPPPSPSPWGTEGKRLLPSLSCCTLIHLKGIYMLLERGKLALLRHETGILAAGDEFLPAACLCGLWGLPCSS